MYHDASYAGEPLDSSSVAGALGFINGTPWIWRVTKVTYVARSSTESELYALDDGLMILETHLDLFVALADLDCVHGIRFARPLGCVTDNRALRDIISSVDDDIGRSLRHLRTRVHRTRHAVRSGLIASIWCPGPEQLADILTKCLHSPLFLDLRASVVSGPGGADPPVRAA
jgi:hypothetical protein